MIIMKRYEESHGKLQPDDADERRSAMLAVLLAAGRHGVDAAREAPGGSVLGDEAPTGL